MFLTLMVMGLVGLAMMAIPAFGRHGTRHIGHPAGGHGAGHAHGHSPAIGAKGGHAPRAAEPGNHLVVAESGSFAWLRFMPSPRVIFTVLALYGAFGNALVEAAHLPFLTAALAAAAPALLLERLLVNPLWNLLFRFQGKESSPLEMLLFSEARAVVPFRNGRGLVSVNRDGRLVQLSACLREGEADQPVRVGDRLTIEDIDARRERVTVSIVKDVS